MRIPLQSSYASRHLVIAYDLGPGIPLRGRRLENRRTAMTIIVIAKSLVKMALLAERKPGMSGMLIDICRNGNWVALKYIQNLFQSAVLSQYEPVGGG